MKRFNRIVVLALGLLLLVPTLALAAPRSGASFGGRGGFRSAPSAPRSYAPQPNRGYGSGPIIIAPGFGWGLPFGGYGYGGGGSLFGGLLILGVLGLGAAMVVRAVRRSRASHARDVDGGAGAWGAQDYEDEVVVAPGRAYVYKVQLGLGRSARGLQQRLTKFAEGDTGSEAGLAQLLQQTALELMREKESIRYAGAEAFGPMNLTNGETKMNALTLAERSRFQVERVRGTEGQVRRSDAASQQSEEVLEYILVTLVVATRTPLEVKKVTTREELDTLLGQLGGVPAQGLLGLEVIWTPADPDDALTETDLMTAYPDLRSV